MAGKVVNSSFLLLSKFGASRQESTSKTATSHIRKPLPLIMLLPKLRPTLFTITRIFITNHHFKLVNKICRFQKLC